MAALDFAAEPFARLTYPYPARPPAPLDLAGLPVPMRQDGERLGRRQQDGERLGRRQAADGQAMLRGLARALRRTEEATRATWR